MGSHYFAPANNTGQGRHEAQAPSKRRQPQPTAGDMRRWELRRLVWSTAAKRIAIKHTNNANGLRRGPPSIGTKFAIGLALCSLLATADSCSLHHLPRAGCAASPRQMLVSSTTAVRSCSTVPVGCIRSSILALRACSLLGLQPESSPASQCALWPAQHLDKPVNGFGPSGPRRSAWPHSRVEPCRPLPLATDMFRPWVLANSASLQRLGVSTLQSPVSGTSD